MIYSEIKFHSFIDVITNSSNEIFTFSGNCVKPAKELLKSIFKSVDPKLDVDKDIVVSCLFSDLISYTDMIWRYIYNYTDLEKILQGKERKWISKRNVKIARNAILKNKKGFSIFFEKKNWDYEDVKDYISDVCQYVIKGAFDKPSWMKILEDNVFDEYYSNPESTCIRLYSVKSEHQEILDKVVKLLYSTKHVTFFCG